MISEHRPAEDAAALHRIALWALRRYSPLVAVDGVDGLWIDATGVAHLFGGEAALLNDLVTRLRRAGGNGRAAIADTAGAAWALARFGEAGRVVSAPGETARDLEALPLASLRLPTEMVEGLDKLGLQTVGDLERTPRAPLAPTAPQTGRSWPARWPRPSRLLSPPERVEAMAVLPDQPPAAFTWRGQRRRVRVADGPERIFGEWWRRDAETSAVRDYFSVEDETGERFWLYRQGDGEIAATGDLNWFLHGLFA